MRNFFRKTSTKIAILAIIAFVALTIFYGMSVVNKEETLRVATANQQKVCMAYFDKMWKVIHQDAKVADQYKEAFKEIYPKLIDGRYSSGELMKWVQESNPDFNITLYSKVMNAIEAQREGFFSEQEQLLSIKQEHDNLLVTMPSKWFLGGVKPVEVKIITSAKTEETFQTGQENDVELF